MKIVGGLVQKRGDWSWMKSCIGMCGWHGEGQFKRVCFKCRANCTTFPYWDHSTGALWRAVLFTHLSFMASCFAEGGFVSTLFQFPGFVHEFISGDLMHACDLGVLQYLCGCVIWELFREMGGTDKKHRHVLADIQTMIRTASKSLAQVQLPTNTLTIGMVKGKSGPKTKTKASEGRRLVFCLRFILENFFPAGADDSHAQLRYQCVNEMCMMYDSLRDWNVGTSVETLALHGRRCLMIYSELSAESLRSRNYQHEGFLVWRQYPKMHLLLHVIEDQVLIQGSPLESWCYADESEIGAAVILAEMSHPSTLHRLVMTRHRLDPVD